MAAGLGLALFCSLAVAGCLSKVEIDATSAHEVAAAVGGGILVLWLIGVGVAAAVSHRRVASKLRRGIVTQSTEEER
jgi:hypothetical protein